jgi:hypothetical protein
MKYMNGHGQITNLFAFFFAFSIISLFGNFVVVEFTIYSILKLEWVLSYVNQNLIND